MNKIIFNEESWPYTGRKVPEGVQLSVRFPCDNKGKTSSWKDLCWYNSTRDIWIYLSTLPK